ncbi:hypothetical protein VP01_633g2 [Puccinia sorghi]|uniref:Uncharacterized protein n=1 Tax=Puccinia sorghi TaxID=27349 RepID=A0A0L6UI88_9BASI|nr:hypothetical protein VP01_633g2 [Puccinia sorghi]
MSKSTRRFHREATSRGKGKQKSIHADYGDANSEEDPLEELTRPQLLEINRVFDTISGNLTEQLPAKEPPQDKSTLPLVEPTQIQPQITPGDVQGGGFMVEDQDTFGGGGFLVEDELGDAALDEPGGFLAEEDNSENHQAGGFLLEDIVGSDVEYHDHQDSNQSSSSSRKVSNYISTRKISDALKMLGLPYRNREILDIFENAASSDEDEPRTTSFRRKEKMISRIKFSKVCAVLMMANGDSHNTTESEENTATDQVDRRRDRAAHNEDDQDYDLDQGASDQASSSASDYQPHRPKDEPPPTRHRSRRANQTRKSRSSPSNSIPSKTYPNRRQAKAKNSSLAENDEDNESAMQDSALETFALFLQPTTKSFDVSNHTIGFDEIRRAADQLNSARRCPMKKCIFEMLNYASYTNDSRVTFHAFEKLIQEIRTI